MQSSPRTPRHLTRYKVLAISGIVVLAASILYPWSLQRTLKSKASLNDAEAVALEKDRAELDEKAAGKRAYFSNAGLKQVLKKAQTGVPLSEEQQQKVDDYKRLEASYRKDRVACDRKSLELNTSRDELVVEEASAHHVAQIAAIDQVLGAGLLILGSSLWIRARRSAGVSQNEVQTEALAQPEARRPLWQSLAGVLLVVLGLLLFGGSASWASYIAADIQRKSLEIQGDQRGTWQELRPLLKNVYPDEDWEKDPSREAIGKPDYAVLDTVLEKRVGEDKSLLPLLETVRSIHNKDEALASVKVQARTTAPWMDGAYWSGIGLAGLGFVLINWKPRRSLPGPVNPSLSGPPSCEGNC